MSLIPPKAPSLPIPDREYTQQYGNQLNNILRLYFNQIDNFNANLADGGPPFNYIDFNTDAVFTPKMGRVGWNSTDQTLDLDMEYGVTQQIGQETYARVQNNTGVTIPNGTVVGFAGAVTNALRVAPYLANGSQPSLYILGVMTHDLPDSGDKGYCTTWGFVRDLDTSAFNVGDVLYASPTVAGGLTKIKPTAPNNVIPLAACIVSDAVNGVIFVRPTITQMQYYGEFATLTTQPVAAINTAYAVVFITTLIGNGVTIGTPASRLVVPQSGLYRAVAGVQVSSTNGTKNTLWTWFRKNGVDLPNTARVTTIDTNGGFVALAHDVTVSMLANDYIELMYAGDSTNIFLAPVAATAFAPAAGAAQIAVTQVQQ